MKKFEVGKTYSCKGTTLSSDNWEFTVIKRTAKTITFVDSLDEQYTRRIIQGDEVESVRPYADDPTESNILLYADSRPY